MRNRHNSEKRLTVQVLSSHGLTPAELAVLELLCQGYSRKEIAQERRSAYGTVSRHIESVSEKLDVNSTAEIISHAVAKGIVGLSLKLIGYLLAGLGFLSIIGHASPPMLVEAVWRGLGGY